MLESLSESEPAMTDRLPLNDTSRPADINYPLVEGRRPPLYRAMKYWGKKPHNIWSKFIETYCPTGRTVVDPFAGSAVAAFEAVKLGRKAIALDLNPLTCFIVEVTSSKFDERAFVQAAASIKEAVASTEVYRTHFLRHRDSHTSMVLNYRWEHDEVVAVALSGAGDERTVLSADDRDVVLARTQKKIIIDKWFPTEPFPRHPSITHRFIADIGGNSIEHLWTRRNLALLAELFAGITAQTDPSIRLQLLSAFIQTLHLCSKMVIPRNPGANREFSGSWGRPDYLIRRRRMEQNPVDVFWRSCIGRQGVLTMMRDAKEAFPSGIKIHDVRTDRRVRQAVDINYGAVDVADLLDYVEEGSADFVITDPPYAGLVRYMPLSVVWLSWLSHIDRRYAPDLQAEITVERGSTASRESYRRRLRNAFTNIYRVLKDEGKLIVTFHHQDVSEFNDFVLAVKGAGFIIDKVTHQYNRRSGESNVANPYGVSASDFYVRCVKHRKIDFSDNAAELERFIVSTAVTMIGRRNEPTPYSFLFQALWPELLQAGFVQPQDSRDEVSRILGKHEGTGKIFSKRPNPNERLGDLWWFNNPGDHINHPDRPLKDRLSDSVLAYMRRHTSAKLDDVIANLFQEYPNGLTPDPRTVGDVLERIAFRSQGKWKLMPEIMVRATQHSDLIESIVNIGKKLTICSFVGRREQPERTSTGKLLRDLADRNNLNHLPCDQQTIDRLEMVDVIFLEQSNPTNIRCLWEVENSTNFTSAIQRGSNASFDIPKFMVIPEDREDELLRVVDPLFKQSFAENGWKYLTYSQVRRASATARLAWDDLLFLGQTL